jgi:hypothetical protein
VIKRNRGRSKEIKNAKNINKKSNRGVLRNKNLSEYDCSAGANPKRRSKSRNYYKIRSTYSNIY